MTRAKISCELLDTNLANRGQYDFVADLAEETSGPQSNLLYVFWLRAQIMHHVNRLVFELGHAISPFFDFVGEGEEVASQRHELRVLARHAPRPGLRV